MPGLLDINTITGLILFITCVGCLPAPPVHRDPQQLLSDLKKLKELTPGVQSIEELLELVYSARLLAAQHQQDDLDPDVEYNYNNLDAMSADSDSLKEDSQETAKRTNQEMPTLRDIFRDGRGVVVRKRKGSTLSMGMPLRITSNFMDEIGNRRNYNERYFKALTDLAEIGK